jgi:hypothetical protein
MLVMVLDCPFCSGLGSELKGCQIVGLCCQYTWTVNPRAVRWTLLNLSEFCGTSLPCSADPFIDLYHRPVFAVWEVYLIKTAYATSNNHNWHALQVEISIIWESVLFDLYFTFFPIKAVNTSVINMNVHMMPSMGNMQDKILLTLHWYSLSCWGNKTFWMGQWPCYIHF